MQAGYGGCAGYAGHTGYAGCTGYRVHRAHRVHTARRLRRIRRGEGAIEPNKIRRGVQLIQIETHIFDPRKRNYPGLARKANL